ncbi:FAD-binding oxidoreductase [Halobacteriovorax sp. JY17]|uniref:FAD-binding oxidoreductase n=1 Tax=Halobacteriovorax sp. JY17 TaxID=2014617 RepID=UPI000C4167B7|nr:FAD-binding oxidoreductase [Halobacteriovorax sp. JY17]PIK14995.1 MAG: hypothetical protein CES88_11725 [Halobacteriovorax sp. JY17]
MKLNKLSPKSREELETHLKSKTPSFYHSSKTSTVIPYDHIESYLEDLGVLEFTMVNLTELPTHMELDGEGNLTIEGPVTWQEAKAYCHSKGRDIMTSPTEELACILAGFATSATGERCFGFGTLRDQVISLEYLNSKAEVHTLSSKNKLPINKELEEYQRSYNSFKDFKNAPFPRMEVETDLLTGTEGQLGVITKAILKTTVLEDRTFIFIKLPKWEENFSKHLEIFSKVQSFRDRIFSCELLDSNSMAVLPEEERIIESGDLIFLEVRSSAFESVYEDLISKFELITDEDMFEVPAAKSHRLRMNVPRFTFERNSRMGVVKKGTDVQVSPEKFPELLEIYKELSTLGIDYNLFGHFGDAHLHFNFLPDQTKVETCQEKLEELYRKVKSIGGSPFAEHGIGLIKQKFIADFLDPLHYVVFDQIKNEHDPENILFPMGFLNLNRSIG